MKKMFILPMIAVSIVCGHGEMYGFEYGDLSPMEKFAMYQVLNESNPDIFYDALFRANVATVKEQLNNGKDPNEQVGPYKRMPLSIVVSRASSNSWQDSEEVVKLLLNKGAKVDNAIWDQAVRSSVFTPLSGHMAEILIKAGARPKMSDLYAYTISDDAARVMLDVPIAEIRNDGCDNGIYAVLSAYEKAVSGIKAKAERCLKDNKDESLCKKVEEQAAGDIRNTTSKTARSIQYLNEKDPTMWYKRVDSGKTPLDLVQGLGALWVLEFMSEEQLIQLREKIKSTRQEVKSTLGQKRDGITQEPTASATTSSSQSSMSTGKAEK